MAIQVELADDEALVLFEFLSSDKLAAVVDTAESHALGTVLARLEERLVAPFAANYSDLVAAARSSLLARYGESTHDGAA